MKKNRLLSERKQPNLVCLCIDRNQDGEIGGKIYNRYSRAPELFDNVVQMIRSLENFYNRISFPQSSMELRGFAKEEAACGGEEESPRSLSGEEELLERRGEYATFLVAVRFRQNATWQGDLYWVEKRQEKKFKSVLELLILIDNILFTKEKENRLREKW